MTVQFDTYGNLIQGIHVLNKEQIYSNFVLNFPNTNTRERLWRNFNTFLDQFKEEITQQFEVWIDGSFATQKLNPRDIDAVFLIDYQTVERKKSILENKWFFKDQKFKTGLDLYFSTEYPITHKKYFLSHLNHLYWEDVYGHTRKDDFGKQHRKGFISFLQNNNL
jgi:hypothetical protein